MFHQNKLNPGEGGTIAGFSRNCIVPLKFVEDYVDHLAQIEMRKEKRRAESERQQTQRMEEDYNDIEWEQLYNSDQISSLQVRELHLYLVRHGIVFKGKKPEKVAYVKAHIASRILPGIEKETPLREETSTLGSESDAEERIVGSETLLTSSRELNDIIDSPVLHTVDTSTSRYGRKRTRGARRPRQLRAIAEQEEERKKE